MSLTSDFKVIENVLVVRLSGELDHHEAVILRETWQRKLREERVQHVILNLEEMTFMDSSGIGVLLGRYKEIIHMGGELVVCSLNPAIRRIFEMSGLFKIIRLAENEQFALDSLGVAS
ncbi:anti-sigma F factor antagonist [Pseudogracilibacillus sp. SE30717A]|uniref:anti-sigma F factor antagonist n=1 Tax=Pseudogracilibacillus sp. SE30717A TaxID=3098293 RepID=UPI00300E14C5